MRKGVCGVRAPFHTNYNTQQQGVGVGLAYNISSNFESFRFTHSDVLVNLDNDCCHVVTAQALAGGDVACTAVV